MLLTASASVILCPIPYLLCWLRHLTIVNVLMRLVGAQGGHE
jgi:hypothetical protein